MTDAGRLRVDGARELRRTLRAAGRNMDPLKATHLKVAKIVDAAADRDPLRPVLSGDLDYSSRAAGQVGAAIVRAGRARVPYAGPIHWGWKKRHIVGQPWIYNAAKDTSDEWLAVYLDGVKKVLNTVEGTTTP